MADGSVLVNGAAAYGAEDDPDEENNDDSASTTIGATADLEITKSAQPDPVAAGATLTYTLAYTNHGPSDAVNVYMTDTLDANVTFGGVVEQPAAWTGFQQNADTLVWYAPSIPAGESSAIVLTVTVNADAIGSIYNSAVIDSDTQDDVPGNNQAETTTTIGDPNRATIYGYVFQDDNCNGRWDAGELRLLSPEVSMAVPAGMSPTYGPNGLFYFITEQPGVHVVVETDPAGYFSTTPNEVHLAVTLGQSYRVDFGDASNSAACAAVYGTVFEDMNSDGAWGLNELGIQEVTVTLDGSASITTGPYGAYTLATTQAGAHTVVETDLPGYASTTPNQVDVDVSLGTGYRVDFGDVPFCTCPGDQYEEDDILGQAKTLGVGETQAHNFCDDAGDWITFQAEARQTYTITTSSWGQRADTNLALYDTDGTTLLMATDDFYGTDDYSSRLVWQAPRDGIYYLLVTNRAGLRGCATEYDLSLELDRVYFLFLPLVNRNHAAPEPAQPAAVAGPSPVPWAAGPSPVPWAAGPEAETIQAPRGIINHTCPDAYEADDTWEIAGPIEDGVPQLHSFDSNPVEWAADKDFVWFDLHGGRTITFTVMAATNTSTLLELYDSQGHALDVTGTVQLVWTAPALGRYYLSVSPQLATYGCTEPTGDRPEVSYVLQADWEPRTFIYIPIMLRN